MMSARIQAVNLAVQHMGNPSQGLPVGGMNMCEGPGSSFECQTPGDLSVFEHIGVVIIINELVAKRLAEDEPGNCGEENAHAKDHPSIVRTRRSVSGLQREGSAATN